MQGREAERLQGWLASPGPQERLASAHSRHPQKPSQGGVLDSQENEDGPQACFLSFLKQLVAMPVL